MQVFHYTFSMWKTYTIDGDKIHSLSHLYEVIKTDFSIAYFGDNLDALEELFGDAGLDLLIIRNNHLLKARLWDENYLALIDMITDSAMRIEIM